MFIIMIQIIIIITIVITLDLHGLHGLDPTHHNATTHNTNTVTTNNSKPHTILTQLRITLYYTILDITANTILS